MPVFGDMLRKQKRDPLRTQMFTVSPYLSATSTVPMSPESEMSKGNLFL